MADSRKLAELSRQELYDLMWASPATKVAADFGISDVAVLKHCIKKHVPRPTRGYWAKIAAGHKPRKKPLPPTVQETFELDVQRRISKTLPLPEPGAPLHPLAAEMLVALKKLKPDYQKLTHLKEPAFPDINISKSLVERAAQSVHVLLHGLEPLGIGFRKSAGKYDSGYFKRGQDRLFITIEEVLIDPLGVERRKHWWQCNGRCTPTGKLAFSIEERRWDRRETREWLETESHSLERVLSELVSAIRLHFLNKQRQHIQEAIDRKKQTEEYEKRHREWLVEEEIRKRKEAEQAHADAIQAVVDARKLDLINAAELWMKSCRVADYIAECEKQWRSSTAELSPDQSAWLAWAKGIADCLSPFMAGYPDPAKHGAFDASAVEFGGPYPTARNFSSPD
jgi:hypothetical protein